MSELAKLFPAAYTKRVPRGARPQHFKPGQVVNPDGRPPGVGWLSTRHRMILTLELRGKDKTEIAQILGTSLGTVYKATSTPRYIEARDKFLVEMDQEFINMKPEAMAALRRGLTSGDTNTALHASETWMKAAGFMQYGRGAGQQGVTAEDVAAQLLQVNININTNPGDKDG